MNSLREPDPLEWARRKLEHEDSLVSHRMSWLMQSEAFLVAAYALQFTTTSADIPKYLGEVIACGGLLSSLLTYSSILAGMSAHRRTRDAFVTKHGRRDLLMAGTKRSDLLGWFSSGLIPPLWCIAWIGALLYETL
jgi:hypothetical protein